MSISLLFSRTVLAVTAVSMIAVSARAQDYLVTNLVSSGSIPATSTDPHLIDGWGLSRSSTSPWWVSDALGGVSTLYNSAGVIQSLVVNVAGAQTGSKGLPTGTVFNGTSSFQLTPGNPALFMFVSLDGTISGWSPKVNAASTVVMVNNPGAVYTGATIASIKGVSYLYVANFASGRIEVYDSSFKRVLLPPEAFELSFSSYGYGRLEDAQGQQESIAEEFILNHRRGSYAPYNIQNAGGTLYVTYVQVDPVTHRNAAGPGLGYVLSFNVDGHYIRALQYGPWFNAPWGITIAPSDFGSFSHCLLVGNFGGGEILAFNVTTGAYVGQLADQNGNNIVIDGLWGISFGNGASAGPLNTLYFAAGPAGETQGLFGSIAPIPSDNTQGNDQ